MNIWSITDTENHILRIYGEEQFRLAKHSLQSINLRAQYARYHYHEANKILDKFLKEQLKTKHPIEVVLESSDQKELTLTRVEANFLACLSNIHAVADTFSYAIYYSFGFNLTKNSLTDDKINTNSVLMLIKSNTDFVLLAKLLGTLKR